MTTKLNLLRLNSEQVCPLCQGGRFYEGPRGGMAVNIQCALCGKCYWYCPPFMPKQIECVEGVYSTEAVSLCEIRLFYRA